MPAYNSAPIWFWIIAVLALLWNAMGTLAFYMDISQTSEQLAQQSQVIQDLYQARPTWAIIAFAVAVLAGLAGSVALLVRSHWALSLFNLSLIGVIAQNFYSFGVAEMHKHIQGSFTLPLIVFLVAVGLVFFARFCRQNNWLS